MESNFNTDSILLSIKKLLGLVEDDQAFDADIIIHINSVFMILQQLGIGPVDGFKIESQEETVEASENSEAPTMSDYETVMNAVAHESAKLSEKLEEESSSEE